MWWVKALRRKWMTSLPKWLPRWLLRKRLPDRAPAVPLNPPKTKESPMSDVKPAYKRILLKLSGEALMGDDQFGINRDTIVRMVDEIVGVTALGVQVAVVIGGGNIFRGVAGGPAGRERA